MFEAVCPCKQTRLHDSNVNVCEKKKIEYRTSAQYMWPLLQILQM